MSAQYRERCLREKGTECVCCGEDPGDDIEVHHVDGDHGNDALSNLVPVCRMCHLSIHYNVEGYEQWTQQLKPPEERQQTPRPDRMQVRLTADRQELLEEVLETSEASNRAEAIDIGLKAYLDLHALLDARAEQAREELGEFDTEVVKISTRNIRVQEKRPER